MTRISEYMVIGRRLPTEKEEVPVLYRMRLFAPNETFAKSRFWYFARQLRKMKKATGEIVAVHKVRDPVWHGTDADRREEAGQGQELCDLAPLQLALGHAQHVPVSYTHLTLPTKA